MNLLNLQPTLSPLNYLNESYTFATPRPQNFSLLYPIMKYIFTNPGSGKAWKKLIQTCKYFFSKNSIYPVNCLQHDYGNEWKADGEIFDSTKNIAKLWIHDKIGLLFNFSQSFFSSIIPKIYKCELRSLNISYQNFTFNEYLFLTSSGNLEELDLNSCTISHSDGSLVTFEQLFGNIYKLEYFNMICAENSSSMFQKDTFKKLTDILPFLKELSRFILDSLTEAFDFSTITDFLLKNETLIILLRFDEDIPLSDAYKEILESFIAKIIETPPKRIPFIQFPEFENSVYYQDYEKLL